MIDTLKIITFVNKKLYDIISKKSNIKTMFNRDSGEVFYEIINDSLEGTYDSRLSVRLTDSAKYNSFSSSGVYCLSIEGSYHKIIKGQNAFDGFYSVQEISLGFIKLVENAYSVKLPALNHWFLYRVDITKTFDLEKQEAVCRYINSLNLVSYPRRNIKFYENETLYCSGQVTTLKIYNKYLEFLKNDRGKVSKFINPSDFIHRIYGFVRFECEVKRKKLIDIYNKKMVRVTLVNYKDLAKVWSDEFMKILKFDEEKKKRVRTKEDVLNRLNTIYKKGKASRLYSFFLMVHNDGYNNARKQMSSTSFYRNISELKDAGIDFSQNNFDEIAKLDFSNMVDFDPFSWKEVV